MQNMTQANTQAVMEAGKAAKMAVEAESQVNTARSVQEMPRASSPGLKQPIFDWKAKDKYEELQNFEINE